MSITLTLSVGRLRPLWYPLIAIRGKKKVAKKQKKTKKDMQKEAIKDKMKRLELEKQLEDAVLRVAKQGEPMDPEMLNPLRKRPKAKLTEEEHEKEFLLVKEWSRYSMQKHKEELSTLQGLMSSRNRALNELRKASYPLYLKALEPRTDLFPFERMGPTETPALPDYQPPEPDDS